MGRLDLLLQAAVRRLSAAQPAVLADPVVTRTLPAGSGTVVSPSQFGKRDQSGDIVLAWHQGARSYGYGTDLLDSLETGATVIAGTPAGIGAEVVARALWPTVAFIHIETGTDRLRSALTRTPRSTNSNAAGCEPRCRRDAAIVLDQGELPAAVRALCLTLERLMPSPLHAGQHAPAPREKPASGARARLAANALAANRTITPHLPARGAAPRSRRHAVST